MGCQEELLVEKICDLYDKISSLDTLKPSKDVDTLFTQLVLTCISPCPIDVSTLPNKTQEIRSHLIHLCGEAEGHLENHYSTLLSSFEDNPLNHLNLFPYYSNYLKLSLLEYNIFTRNCNFNPTRIAFIGSGPLPLTSIVLASNHLMDTTFHNYDIDPLANLLATRLVSSDPDLSQRMFFHTDDIMNVTSALKEYDVVFLAALVGMNKEDKTRVIEHLNKYMAPGAVLMLRSAHGARAFLYPVVDLCDLRGFEVLSVFHPTDDVVNSVVIARKFPHPQGITTTSLILPPKCSKCSEIHPFNHHPLNQMNMLEDFAVEEQIS